MEEKKLNLHEAIKELCLYLYLVRVNFVFASSSNMRSSSVNDASDGDDLNRTQYRLYARRSSISLSYRKMLIKVHCQAKRVKNLRSARTCFFQRTFFALSISQDRESADKDSRDSHKAINVFVFCFPVY